MDNQERKEQRKNRHTGENSHFRSRRMKNQYDDPREKKQRNLRRRASRDRRSNRRGNMGRAMEERVLVIGDKMVEEGLIERFIYHEPNSPEDKSGQDFTVTMVVGGKEVEYSFGITISHGKGSNLKRARYRYDTRQWQFPWNINDVTVQKKILGLFDADVALPREVSEIPDEVMREFLTGST